MSNLLSVVGPVLVLFSAIVGALVIGSKVTGTARLLGVLACGAIAVQAVLNTGLILLGPRIFRSGLRWIYGGAGAFSLLLGLTTTVLFVAAVCVGRAGGRPPSYPPAPTYPSYPSYPQGPGQMPSAGPPRS